MRQRLDQDRKHAIHLLTGPLLKAIPLFFLILLGGCASVPEATISEPIVFPVPPDSPRYYYERTLFGTGAVKVTDKMDKLKSLLTGSHARDGYSFAKPFDVAVHRGRLFVSDTVHRLVFALDFVTGESLIIGDSGDAGDLFKPLGLATDDEGNLYVCDIQLKKVMAYTRNGEWRYDIDLSNEMDRPSGLEVSGDGSTVYVVDIGGVKSSHHAIVLYDTLTRSPKRTLGTRGTGEGEFNLPRDVAIDSAGHLYVTDSGNFRVQVIDQDGRFIRAWGSPGRHLGQFTRPKGIAADASGNIYVVDAAFGNFQIFSSEGELLLYLGSRSEIAGAAKYMLPAGIDVDEDGRIFVVDQFYRKVEVFRPAGLGEDAGFVRKND